MFWDTNLLEDSIKNTFKNATTEFQPKMTGRYFLFSPAKEQTRNNLKCDSDLWISAVWIEISLILYCMILFIFFIHKFFINLCQCCSYCWRCQCCTTEEDQKDEQAEQLEKYNPDEEILHQLRPLMSPMQNYNLETGTDDRSTSTITVENENSYMINEASISESDILPFNQSQEKIDSFSNDAQDNDGIDVDDDSKLNEKITVGDKLPDNRNISLNLFHLGAISKKKKSKKLSTEVQKDIITIKHCIDHPDDEILENNDGHEEDKKPKLFSKLINFLKGKQHNSDFDVEGKNWLPLKESDEKSQTPEVNNQIVEEPTTSAETPETLEK